jgi:galactokinase
MDQFTSVMGLPDHLLLLDCRSTQIELVPLADPHVTVLIINSNVRHELTGGEYAERRSQCAQAARALGVPALRDATLAQLEAGRAQLADVLYRRARHVIGENERTTQAAVALRRGDWPEIGRLMYASHASLRDDYEVSCPELDLLVELARNLGEAGGVVGSRMTGGGFGGCTVSLVRTEAVHAVADAIARGYQQQTGIAPTVFTSRPARGAHVVSP